MTSTVPSPSRSSTPPEEQFWQRYSPHYEFPLSSATSVGLHILVFLLLALGAWWIARMTSAEQRPLSDVPVVVAGPGNRPAGGSGSPRAGSGAPDLVEEKGSNDNAAAKPNAEPPRKDLPPRSPAPTPIVPPASDEESKRHLIDRAHRSSEETQKRLVEGLRSGKDKPGPGGIGKDKQVGDFEGLGTPEKRVERMGRWVMVFETVNGDDYARQLAGLGAILAVPERDGENVTYSVYRDLHARPAHGKIEDIAEIHRGWWEDTKRESITPLCQALGIRPVPDHILAFFPPNLERRLLSMELQYKGLKEEQIERTWFKVRKTGTGYEPIVTDQKAR
jgi:hypothetical protein